MMRTGSTIQRRAAPEAHLGVTREGLWLALKDVALPVWFVTVYHVFWIFNPWAFGIDARLYQTATSVWLAGGDPWATTANGVPFAAAPWSLLMYAPTAWLPLEVAAGLWIALGAIAAIWTIRFLELPLWWLLFPPLMQALWNGNAQPIVLAALLIRSPFGVTVAGMLKLYGLVPALLALRWRQLAIAAALLAVTVPFLPWSLWVEHHFGFDAVAGHTWNGSAWQFPPLWPLAAIAIWLLRGHGAEWLAIPALWPGTQPYYHVFAMPALVGRPWLAAALALPLLGLAPVAIVAYALVSNRTYGFGRRTRSSE
jgi:hypothetical protein